MGVNKVIAGGKQGRDLESSLKKNVYFVNLADS